MKFKILESIILTIVSTLTSHVTATPSMNIRTPQFADYDILENVYNGKPSPVVLRSQADRDFRTRLRDASKEPANFAGEYSLAIWGCGTSCLMGAAVQLKTGNVIFMPGTISNWKGEGDPISFQLKSRLLIASGYINEKGKYGKHYYEFTGHAFKHIKTVISPSVLD
jgi:hypothetical protein